MPRQGKMHGSPFHIENLRSLYAKEHEDDVYNKPNNNQIKCAYKKGMIQNCTLWNSPSKENSCLGDACPIHNAQIGSEGWCTEQFNLFRISTCPTHRFVHTCNECSEAQRENCKRFALYVLEKRCSDCKSNFHGFCVIKFSNPRRCPDCAFFDKNEKCTHPNRAADSFPRIYSASYCRYFEQRQTTPLELIPDEKIKELKAYMQEELNFIQDLNHMHHDISNSDEKCTRFPSVYSYVDQLEAIEQMISYRKERVQYCLKQIALLINDNF